MSLLNKLPGMAIFTTVDQALNWGRKSSIWYMMYGLACCAIEMMQTGGPRSDMDRFGTVFRATPRQSDLLAMGSCASSGGLFQLAYSVCDGVDKIIPVDVYVPGCPPRPEALTEGLLKLQEKIMQEKWLVRKADAKEAPAA